MKKFMWCLVFLILMTGCGDKVEVEEISKDPELVTEDKKDLSVDGYFRAKLIEKMPDYVGDDFTNRTLLVQSFQSEMFVIYLDTEMIENLEKGQVYEFYFSDVLGEDYAEADLKILDTAEKLMMVLKPRIVASLLVDEADSMEGSDFKVSDVKLRKDSRLAYVEKYLYEDMTRVLSDYYQVLDYDLSDLKMEDETGSFVMEFEYRLTYKNYPKDPDTVDYIREAKEKNDKDYQKLYDEYLAIKTMDFGGLRVEMKDGEKINLYTNISPDGVEWVPFKPEDIIIK